MFMHSWRRWLGHPPRTIRHPRPRCALRVEELENRVVPTGGTLTVTTTSDAHALNPADGTGHADAMGHVSLRSAIETAEAVGSDTAHPFTINIGPGTYTLTLGELAIDTSSNDNDVIISGTGTAANTTIGASTGARIFDIDQNGNGGSAVALSNVTLTGGNVNAFGGGAIIDGAYNSGVDTLSLTACTLSKNTSNGTSGGAIEMTNGGNLTVTGCTFAGNTAAGNTGGAIDFEPQGATGALMITDSTFTGNMATTVGNGQGQGGALFLNGGSGVNTTKITGSTFIGNGADFSGGAIDNAAGDLVMHDSRLVGNTSATGDALFENSSGATANVSNNWWGQNANPTTVSNLIAGSAGLTASPWLVMTFTSSPTSLNPGNTATLTAAINTNSTSQTGFSVPDGTPVTFAATHGGVNPSSATTTSGSATSTYTPTSGYGGNANVSATVDNQTLSVQVADNQPPAVQTNPTAQTVLVGQTATFTASATGFPTPTVVWQVSTDGTHYTPLTDGGVYSGTQTPTLQVTPTDTSLSGDQYRAVFSNSAGSATSGSATLTVTAASNLSITSNVGSPNPVVAGNQLTFTVTIQNSGTQDAQGVSVTDMVPAGTSFVSASAVPGQNPDGFSYSQSAGTVTGTPTGGVVAAGSTDEFTLVVQTLSSDSNQSTISASADVTTSSSNAATTTSKTAMVDVNTQADLSISASGPSSASAGDPAGFDYVLTVTNNGPSDNTGGFTVSDTLPAGTTFVPGSSTAGAAVNGQTITYTNTAGLAASGQQSFTIHVTVANSASGTMLQNSATVTSNGTTDPSPGNNTSNTVNTNVPVPTPVLNRLSTTTAAEGSGPLALTLTGSNFQSGATVQWNSNSLAPTSISGTQIQVTVPASLLAEEGSASVSVVNPGSHSSANSIAFTITDAPLTAQRLSVSATTGAPFRGAVAGFSDGNAAAPLADFTATINWGDGTPATTGVVTASIAAAGSFTVAGSHTYAFAGPHTVLVTVHDVGGQVVTIASTVTVTDSAQAVAHGASAGIAFWNGARGQALIRSFNAGPNDTALSAWLATSFPNLYGPPAGAGNNLTGKSNAQVALFYQRLFALPAPQVEAEALALALNVYATTTSLGGNATATTDGFQVSSQGFGAQQFNVGASGAALSLTNNASYSVFCILAQVNAKASGGTVYGTSSVLRRQVNSLLDAINAAGGL